MVERTVVPDHGDAMLVAPEILHSGALAAAVVDDQHLEVRIDRESENAVDATCQPIAIPGGDDDADPGWRVRQLPGDPVEAPLPDPRRGRPTLGPLEVVYDRTLAGINCIGLGGDERRGGRGVHSPVVEHVGNMDHL